MNQDALIQSKTQTLLWFGLLGLVLVFIMAIMTTTISMENRLLGETNALLKEAQYHRIIADINGRDVTLKGAVGSQSAGKAAKHITANIPGARKVETAFEVLPIRLPHIKLIWAADSIAVSGELPNSLLQEELHQLLKARLPSAQFKSLNIDITINTELAEPNWLPAFIQSFEQAQQLKTFKIEIGASHLIFNGIVENREQYDEIIAQLVAITRENGLKLINQLAILSTKG